MSWFSCFSSSILCLDLHFLLEHTAASLITNTLQLKFTSISYIISHLLSLKRHFSDYVLHFCKVGGGLVKKNDQT